MAQHTKFSGVFTALVTPFKQGKVDEQAFADLIDWQISEGVHGIVPCGTTGESPTLTHEEHKRVVEIAVKAASGRVPVMAGTGSNSTEEAIDFTKHAAKAGADAALVVSPYYNKPTQEGLYQHFKAVQGCSDLKVVIYNIPPRSVVDISNATLARLAELPNILGVKDATGDLARVSTLRHLVGDRLVLFSGEDMTAPGFNAQGGVGCISVTSNVAPKRCAEVQNLLLKGDYAGALKIHDTLVAVHTAMFLETSPAPVKHALSLMTRCLPDLRLPLVPPQEATKAAIEKALKGAGILP